MKTNEKFEFHKRLLDQFEELILYPTDAGIRFLTHLNDFDSKGISDIREKHQAAMRSFVKLRYLTCQDCMSETAFRIEFDKSKDLEIICEEFTSYETICNTIDNYGNDHGFLLDGMREELRSVRNIIINALPSCRLPINPNALICRVTANDDPALLRLLEEYSNAVEDLIYTWENLFSKGKYVMYYRKLIDKQDDSDIDNITCRIDSDVNTINRTWEILSKSVLVIALGDPIEKFADIDELYSVDSIEFLRSVFRNPSVIPIANI